MGAAPPFLTSEPQAHLDRHCMKRVLTCTFMKVCKVYLLLLEQGRKFRVYSADPALAVGGPSTPVKEQQEETFTLSSFPNHALHPVIAEALLRNCLAQQKTSTWVPHDLLVSISPLI